MSNQQRGRFARHVDRHNARVKKIEGREAMRNVSISVSPTVLEEQIEIVETLGFLHELAADGEVAPSDFHESTQHLQRSLRNNL